MGENEKKHPIEGLMTTAMDSIQKMIDVNTIIGDPIETSVGSVIIPISKVTFGFAAGGSEFNKETVNQYERKDKDEQIQYNLPFGGGSGATISLKPIAFLIVKTDTVKILPVHHDSTLDKLLDYAPEIIDKIEKVMKKEDEN